MINLWNIIRFMLKLHKRSWQVFFPAFTALIIAAAITYVTSEHKEELISFILFSLSILALVFGIICYVYDWRSCRKEDSDSINKDGFPKIS